MSTNLGEWAAGQLAGGAVGAVGGDLLNMGLSKLGIPLSGDDSAALAQIQAELDQIVSMVAAVQNQINALEVHLTQQIKQSEFDTRASLLEPLVQSIYSLTQTYHQCVVDSQNAENDAATIARIATAKNQILDEIGSTLLNHQSDIHSEVAGGAGTESLYEVYAEMRKLAHRFLSSDDSDAMQARIDYYQNAQYLQKVLVVNYHNAGRGLPSGAAAAETTYKQNIDNENAFFQVVPVGSSAGMIVDQKTQLLLYVENCEHVTCLQAKELAADAGGAGGIGGWRLPSTAELIPKEHVPWGEVYEKNYDQAPSVSIFTDYDSEGGKVSPSDWLTKNGVNKSLAGFHIWTDDIPLIPSPVGPGGRMIPIPFSEARYFVDITDETTLFQVRYGGGDMLGHTLRVQNITWTLPYVLVRYQ